MIDQFDGDFPKQEDAGGSFYHYVGGVDGTTGKIFYDVIDFVLP